jgi:flagellar biosynthesis regulator FlaF
MQMIQKNIELDCIKLEKQLEILHSQRDMIEKEIDDIEWELRVMSDVLDDMANPDNQYFI